jgi:DNA-directed RNA polymerase subunit RPC12/RpoP
MLYKAYYCQPCGWASQAIGGDWAMVQECPMCGHRALHFVMFERHEKYKAEKIVGRKLTLIPPLTAAESSGT